MCRPTAPRRALDLTKHGYRRGRTRLCSACRAWDVIRLSHSVHPCGNFSGTSSLKFRGTKGSIGHTFMVCIHTENQNQEVFCPFTLKQVSVLLETPLGHFRYGLRNVPPQPNSPTGNVFNPDRSAKDFKARMRTYVQFRLIE